MHNRKRTIYRKARSFAFPDRPSDRIEIQIMQYLSKLGSEIVRGIVYSVEHMTVTQWAILGTTSVVLGFMCLRTTRF